MFNIIMLTFDKLIHFIKYYFMIIEFNSHCKIIIKNENIIYYFENIERNY